MTIRMKISTNAVDVTALHYWELSQASSVSGGVLGERATLDDRRPAYEVLQGGWSRALRGGRLALDGRFVLHQDDIPHLGSRHTYEAAASWTRRGVLGTLRLGIAYER